MCSPAGLVVSDGLHRHETKVRPRLRQAFRHDLAFAVHGVTLEDRVRHPQIVPTEVGKDVLRYIRPAVDREQVYTFAWGCIERGRPEPAAAAVICFEWLQRPENVLAGYIRWTDYRSKGWPNAIHIEHHKTGEQVWHPLEETINEVRTAFYVDAEAVLAELPRRGIPMILRQMKNDSGKPYSFSGIQNIVHQMRDKILLPSTFTLDACRHGGITELEEAELTDGQGRALSAHKSQQFYEGYAKRTMKRALAATRKRHAHLLANEARTDIQNNARNEIQNDDKKPEAANG